MKISKTEVIKLNKEKISDEMWDRIIELFFFNPQSQQTTYDKAYQSIFEDFYKQEKVCRYSPLYKLLVDIKYCFGFTTALKPQEGYPRDALRAGIILIDLGFGNLVKKIFQGELEDFGKRYMNLENDQVKALRWLRNALAHNFYSFSYVHNDKEQGVKTKYNFYLSITFDKAIEKIDTNSISTEKMIVERYKVNPRKVYTAFTNGLKKFKEDLLNKQLKYRRLFKSSFNLDYWTAVYSINSPS